MEGKDDRSKAKRSKMKQHNRRAAQRAPAAHSSSSTPIEPVRGVIDVADSSDERFIPRKTWNQQKNRDLLDTLDLDELNDIDNNASSAGDFDIMAQMPASVGGHFLFSSEKQWDLPEGEQLLDNTEASEYFMLNAKLLNVGLQTIPFYKRMDYPSSLFTGEQILSMEKAAEVAENNYKNVLKEHEANPRIKINNSRKSGSAKTRISDKTNPKVNQKETDELDELLNLTADEVGKVDLNKNDADKTTSLNSPNLGEAVNKVAIGSKDDIQEWLDNVLEE